MKKIKESMVDYIKNNKPIIGIIIILTIIAFILSFNKGTFAIEKNVDSISIECSDIAHVGEEIKCSIILNSVTIETQGVSAKYNITEGIEFVKFTPSEGWTDYSGNNPNGFTIVNFDGVVGNNLLGTISYKVSSNANSNDLYKIELTNTTIGDGEDITISLDDASDEIRIASDINTLDNITISNGTLNEIFNKDINEYTGIVNSDKIIIDVIKTDSNSIVSGDVGEVMLHYGTNIFNIVVTSESGKVNIYKITIFRKYDFSIDTYIYDKENNYIYTGRDTESSIILSNLNLPVELKGKIENNKLIISYLEEVLLKIDIVNFISNEYSILNNTIYIGNDLDYSDFINTISMNGVVFKIYNGNIEITSGIIDDSYKLVIYYKNNLLEEFVFKKDYLKISNLNIDDENNIIKRVELNTTYEKLLSNILTSGIVSIKDKKGNILSASAKVKSGDMLEIKMLDRTYKYTVSVLGDITGTGTATLGDVAMLYRYMKKPDKNKLELYQVAAGDVIASGNIKVNDVSRIYRYIKGKITNIEVQN